MSGRGHPFCVFPGFFSSLFLSLSLSLSLFGWNGSVVHDIRASEHEMIGDDGRALHFLSAIAARWRSFIGSSFFFSFFPFFFFFFAFFHRRRPAPVMNETNRRRKGSKSNAEESQSDVRLRFPRRFARRRGAGASFPRDGDDDAPRRLLF